MAGAVPRHYTLSWEAASMVSHHCTPSREMAHASPLHAVEGGGWHDAAPCRYQAKTWDVREAAARSEAGGLDLANGCVCLCA